MIQRPKRSVTRFFIPMIDVLILLFAIFIMLPVVDDPSIVAETPDGPQTVTPEDFRELQRRVQEAQKMIAKFQGRKASPEELQKELERLRQRLRSLPEALEPRELFINREDGELYYAERDRRPILIQNQTQATSLVESLRNDLRNRDEKDPLTSGNQRQLLLLIRRPRQPTGFPTVRKREQIQNWFRDVQYRWVSPIPQVKKK